MDNLNETDLLDDRSSFEEFNVVPKETKLRNNSPNWKHRKSAKWTDGSGMSKDSQKYRKIRNQNQHLEKRRRDDEERRQSVPQSEIFEYDQTESAQDPLSLVSPPAKSPILETLDIDNPAPATSKYQESSIHKQSKQASPSDFLQAPATKP